MKAILEQTITENRVKLFGSDGRKLGSLTPESFTEVWGGDKMLKLWQEKNIEIPEIEKT